MGLVLWRGFGCHFWSWQSRKCEVVRFETLCVDIWWKVCLSNVRLGTPWWGFLLFWFEDVVDNISYLCFLVLTFWVSRRIPGLWWKFFSLYKQLIYYQIYSSIAIGRMNIAILSFEFLYFIFKLMVLEFTKTREWVVAIFLLARWRLAIFALFLSLLPIT